MLKFELKKIKKIIKDIEEITKSKKVVLVAIDGNRGSRKTTLSNFFKRKIDNLNVVRKDLYSSPYTDNQTFDAEYLRKVMLLPLKKREDVSPQIYHWAKKSNLL